MSLLSSYAKGGICPVNRKVTQWQMWAYVGLTIEKDKYVLGKKPLSYTYKVNCVPILNIR